MPKKTIYIDLDGVLVDLFSVLNQKYRNYKYMTESQWHDTMSDREQWKDLPVTYCANAITKAATELFGGYAILSKTAPEYPHVEVIKRDWVAANLAYQPKIVLCIPFTKAAFSGKNHILVDDFGENLREWELAGGTGIKFKAHKPEKYKLHTLIKTLKGLAQ